MRTQPLLLLVFKTLRPCTADNSAKVRDTHERHRRQWFFHKLYVVILFLVSKISKSAADFSMPRLCRWQLHVDKGVGGSAIRRMNPKRDAVAIRSAALLPFLLFCHQPFREVASALLPFAGPVLGQRGET